MDYLLKVQHIVKRPLFRVISETVGNFSSLAKRRNLGSFLFYGIALLFPIIGATGWFGPSTFAECMKEELKQVKNGEAEKYIRDYCFDKFCRDKGYVTQIDNRQVAAQCQELAASYTEIKSGQEDKVLQ